MEHYLMSTDSFTLSLDLPPAAQLPNIRREQIRHDSHVSDESALNISHRAQRSSSQRTALEWCKNTGPFIHFTQFPKSSCKKIIVAAANIFCLMFLMQSAWAVAMLITINTLSAGLDCAVEIRSGSHKGWAVVRCLLRVALIVFTVGVLLPGAEQWLHVGEVIEAIATSTTEITQRLSMHPAAFAMLGIAISESIGWFRRSSGYFHTHLNNHYQTLSSYQLMFLLNHIKQGLTTDDDGTLTKSGTDYFIKYSAMIMQVFYQIECKRDTLGEGNSLLSQKDAQLKAIVKTQPYQDTFYDYLTNIVCEENVGGKNNIDSWIQHCRQYYLLVSTKGHSLVIINHAYYTNNLYRRGQIGGQKQTPWENTSFFLKTDHSPNHSTTLSNGYVCQNFKDWKPYMEGDKPGYPFVSRAYDDYRNNAKKSDFFKIIDSLIPKGYYNRIIKKATLSAGMSRSLASNRHQRQLSTYLVIDNQKKTDVDNKLIELSDTLKKILFDILKLENSNAKTQAFALLCLAHMFCKLCSDKYFGDGKQITNLGLRNFSLMCLNSAYQLDTTVTNYKNLWEDQGDYIQKFREEFVSNTCANSITGDLEECIIQNPRFSKYSTLLNNLYPEPWQFWV